ncbi:unnamed protein product, partial [Cuscuta europaea]
MNINAHPPQSPEINDNPPLSPLLSPCTDLQLYIPAAHETQQRDIISAVTQNRGKYHVLNYEEKNNEVNTLLAKSVNGKLKGGVIQAVANEFNVSRRTISTIWQRVQTQLKNGEEIDVSSKLRGNVGRKRIQLNLEQIK